MVSCKVSGEKTEKGKDQLGIYSEIKSDEQFPIFPKYKNVYMTQYKASKLNTPIKKCSRATSADMYTATL